MENKVGFREKIPSVLNRLNFQLKLKKSRFLENRFVKSTLLGNRLSLKIDLQVKLIMKIDLKIDLED